MKRILEWLSGDFKITRFWVERPKYIRKGQMIFNFLEWLRTAKNLPTNQSERMADPFYFSDTEWDCYYQEYLNSLKSEIQEKEEGGG